MIAARIHKAKDLRIEQMTPERIQFPDQVRVKIEAAGICGSDLHVYQTGDYLTRTPITMGHEFSGQVLEIGDNTKNFCVGDHVIGDSRVVCGTCEHCTENLFNLCENLGFLGEVCEGAFTDEIVLSERNLVKIDPRVPAHIGALAEPLAVALHAVNLSRASKAKNCLILGAGPIGALIHTVLKIQDVQDLTITDRSKYRCQVIESLKWGSKVTSLAGGEYDLIFETTGSSTVLREVVPECLGRAGQAILVGLFPKQTTFNFTDVVEHEWDIKGCNCFSDELSIAVALLEKYPDRFEHVVSHKLPVSKVQEAFDLLIAPKKRAMKIILMPKG